MEYPLYASVYVDLAVNRLLEYAIPPALVDLIHPGSRVRVHVQRQLCTATVIEIKKKTLLSKISPIQEVTSEAIPQPLITLALWISHYYCAPFFKVVKLLLPPSVRKGMGEKTQLFVQPLLSRPKLAKLCTEQAGGKRKVIEILLQHPKGMLLSMLLESASTSAQPIHSLAKEGVLSLAPCTIDRALSTSCEFFPTKPKTLNEEQSKALSQILHHFPSFETHLLFGVTGSGKTEVYLQAIDRALKSGKSALFLVPEIALTSQTIESLTSRFQTEVAVLHHRLSNGERRDTWHKIRSGSCKLVVGTRSAVFSPMHNLGIIIVDEEHDSAYKHTEEAPCYHARDVAVMRGKIEEAVVVLGSATPSLESYQNAISGKYRIEHLSCRADRASLPKVEQVDMRLQAERGNRLFSDLLLQEMQNRFELGEQSLLFLNRRGFHTCAMCEACEEPLSCPHCSITLTFHKGNHRLACHLCNFEQPPPSKCPACANEGPFQFKGVGTEQVERALHALFPHIRSLRLDADTTRHKGSHTQVCNQFRSGKADVLIGTQMIAKGLHFPSVTLVGILNADAGLHLPDFRAGEQMFQLITQVAGRSGRGTLPGMVIVQTRMPNYPLLSHAIKLDYPSFFQEEVEVRKTFHFPPFYHLVKLVFSGVEEALILRHAQSIQKILIAQLPSHFEIHPVIPCGYAKVKDLFRFQCLIKGKGTKSVTDILRTVPRNKSVRMLIDVDPLSTYF